MNVWAYFILTIGQYTLPSAKEFIPCIALIASASHFLLDSLPCHLPVANVGIYSFCYNILVAVSFVVIYSHS